MCRGRPVHRSYVSRQLRGRATTTCSCSEEVSESSQRGPYDRSLPSARVGGGPATATASRQGSTAGSRGQGSAVTQQRATSCLAPPSSSSPTPPSASGEP